MQRLRVLLADDHVLVAEGIRSLVEREHEIVGVVADGRSLVTAAGELRPDVTLLDIGMPMMNGIEAARRITETKSGNKLIFVTMQTDRDYVRAAFRAGASGYVLKQAAPRELSEAIRTVIEGHRYVSLSVGPIEMQECFNSPATPDDRLTVPLTPRQREVLQLIAEGKSGKEIAYILSISPKTVEFHKAGIMDILQLRSTAELTRYAIERGIVTGS
jgi:DNA-binding NarL/FixJ family response regulator